MCDCQLISVGVVSEAEGRNRPQGKTPNSLISPAHSPVEEMAKLMLPKKDKEWSLAVAEERFGSTHWIKITGEDSEISAAF